MIAKVLTHLAKLFFLTYDEKWVTRGNFERTLPLRLLFAAYWGYYTRKQISSNIFRRFLSQHSCMRKNNAKFLSNAERNKAKLTCSASKFLNFASWIYSLMALLGLELDSARLHDLHIPSFLLSLRSPASDSCSSLSASINSSFLTSWSWSYLT